MKDERRGREKDERRARERERDEKKKREEERATMLAALLGASTLTLLLHAGAPSAMSPRARVKMSLAVFGATGGVGSEVAFQALGKGEVVRALVRDKSRLTVPPGSGGAAAGTPLVNEALTVFEGTVTSAADVAKVFESGDVTGTARWRTSGRTLPFSPPFLGSRIL